MTASMLPEQLQEERHDGIQERSDSSIRTMTANLSAPDQPSSMPVRRHISETCTCSSSVPKTSLSLKVSSSARISGRAFEAPLSNGGLQNCQTRKNASQSTAILTRTFLSGVDCSLEDSKNLPTLPSTLSYGNDSHYEMPVPDENHANTLRRF